MTENTQAPDRAGGVTDAAEQEAIRAYTKVARTSCSRQGMRAALEAASLPSRPEPAAPVVPDKLRELSEKADRLRVAADRAGSIMSAEEREAIHADDDFRDEASAFVRALIARQPTSLAVSDGREED